MSGARQVSGRSRHTYARPVGRDPAPEVIKKKIEDQLGATGALQGPFRSTGKG
jgi:hypothetical protein